LEEEEKKKKRRRRRRKEMTERIFCKNGFVRTENAV